MKKSKLPFAMLSLAALFLLAAAAYALTGTLANEVYEPLEQVMPGPYTEEKVVPPGWCAEHGYIATWNPDDPYVCILCE